ncbi:hypothetical protein QYE76_012401 [Lolium multiflorum]|uniref:Retrotransposon gag domain-containing protein n=1 Tax=Lolium multiflorum TaxID=4521 RepID=A0AAD8X6M4_LOLMU|nr:hypothetical protein QYE76_012401 [Lolium multiflorum]
MEPPPLKAMLIFLACSSWAPPPLLAAAFSPSPPCSLFPPRAAFVMPGGRTFFARFLVVPFGGIVVDEKMRRRATVVEEKTPPTGTGGEWRNSAGENGDMQANWREWREWRIWYQEEASIARGVEEQLDVKKDVKLDKELDMKISHGRAREREECERKKTSRRSAPVDPPRRLSVLTRSTPYAHPVPGPADASCGCQPDDFCDVRLQHRSTGPPDRPVTSRLTGSRTGHDEELKGTVDEIKQTLDATNATVTGLADQVTDIQRNIADMLIAIENLTAQQQQQEDDEDPELEDDAHNARGAPRGHRPRGWVPLGRNGRGQDEEDGLGKPKFSIPKFEGGADVEEYLTWELKIEKLWSLHPNYSEDKKIKLASSEFDGYALRWWDSLVRNRDEDGAQPIRTWRAMKEVMTSRFVPTNYMRNIFDKLTLLRQGVKTVDEYYMEMEMLMQHGRVRTCYGSWAFYIPRALYGAGAFDALRSFLYSA